MDRRRWKRKWEKKRRVSLALRHKTVSNEKRRDEEAHKCSRKGVVSLRSDCHGGGGEELKMLFHPRPLHHMTVSAVAERTVDSG